MRVRRVYLDTEFLPADPTNRGLVSIGLTDDQNRSYYAVNRDVDADALLRNTWMRNHVVPYLPRTRESVDATPNPFGNTVGSSVVVEWQVDWAHADVKPLETIRSEVSRYFADTHASETRLYAYYGGQDIGRLHMLWDNNWPVMPQYIPQWFTELQALIVDAGNPRLPEQRAGEHHALADAEYSRLIHEHLLGLAEERSA